MNSPGGGAAAASLSPSYRNLRLSKLRQSPIEIKEKMRKDFREKNKNCRNVLLNKLRGSIENTGLKDRLTDMYKNMFDFSQDFLVDDEEHKVLEEIRNELVQEEFDWWLQEYEKSTMENVDWSQIEQENIVICPICQKCNNSLKKSNICCTNCNYMIPTTKSLSEVKSSIEACLEKHDKECSNSVQFNLVSEISETHIYLTCDLCHDMQVVI